MKAIRDVAELEERLSEPTERVVQTLSKLEGDVLVLGVGGKMGPSLARMARRALDEADGKDRRVIGVSRFSNPAVAEALQEHSVETISGDMLDEQFVASLPEAANVVYLLGMKFGTEGHQSQTWAINTYAPSLVCRRFPQSRIVALSTGNVYGLVPVAEGPGSIETDVPNPLGEYAMSCLGGERMFEYFSDKLGVRTSIIRLNYAVELRYGILVDMAKQICDEKPIDVTMGYANTVWQADACAYTLCTLAQADSPPFYLNVTGPELIRCRAVCEQMGRLMDKAVQFSGVESPTALLSSARRAIELYGEPRVNVDQLVRWIAEWLKRGGQTWDKPTHFEVRDGKF